MARVTVGQKGERVLKFLLGLRNRKIAGALMAHGFTNDDLAEGWALLQKITRTKLDASLEIPESEPSLLPALDRWENKWFPIAMATLQRRAPKVKEWMFQNLSQTEGPGVILSVSLFIERWEGLAKSKALGGYGPSGKDAQKLLAQRGLHQATIDEAKALLKQFVALDLPQKAESADESGAWKKAEAELWAYYLEWSRIARSAIKDRSLLRQLGFLKPNGSKAPAEESEGEGEGAGDEDEGEGEGEAVERSSAPVGGLPAKARAPSTSAAASSRSARRPSHR